ncbi:Arylsulfatase [hydrothermal vent metagenome]|uniref:Arylsulfatase n=1 Tax=hydrothermal vent metagenome TaxID=652676 RepID=A0A3B1DEU0_9ZZZZ
MKSLIPSKRFCFVALLLSMFVTHSLFFPPPLQAETESKTKTFKKKPNILFIYTDDHSYRTISCYKEAFDWVKTPNIDKLAKRGVRFTNAYIGTWCMPSRATLLTGFHQHGVKTMRMKGTYPNSEYDPKQCKFWPAEFRKKGYTTAHIGKWHTGTDTGFGRDWDYQVVWNRPRYPENSRNYYYNQLIETNGGKPKLEKGYSTDNYTKLADEFIQGKHRDSDKPWYLWLCYTAVHDPFTPAKRHLKKYPNPKVPVPQDIFPPRKGKPAYVNKGNWFTKGKDGRPYLVRDLDGPSKKPISGIHGATLTDWVRQYHQGVVALDESVGRLVKTLEKTKQLENTLIIFTSDQGFAWGQHGFCVKLAPYDATIRSPLIISMPGTIPEGKVCKKPVGGVDLVPTIFQFANLELPWEMHGRDLSPLLKNPDREWNHPLLTTFFAKEYGDDTATIPKDPKKFYQLDVPWWVSLHDGKYKYIRTLVEGETEELYDMKNDPQELDNLALHAKQSSRVRKFRQATIQELRRTGAKIVDSLPAVKRLPGE